MLQEAIDRCVQCGFCLQSCPTYRLTDDEEESPRGRIALAKAILQGQVEASARTLRTFDDCLGCRACEAACPSGVHYAEILMYGRAERRKLGPPTPWHVRLLYATIRRPGRLVLARRAWRLLGRFAIAGARLLRPKRPPLTLLAALPAPAPQSCAAEEGPVQALIHRGCLMNVFWEGTNARAALLLRQAGVRAGLMDESVGCCGAMHAHDGDVAAAQAMAKNVIAAFEQGGAERIVSLAGGCGAFLKEYPDLFAGDAAWYPRARRLAAAVSDVSTLLAAAGATPKGGGGRMTYQDSCHLRNGLGVIAPPRALLRQAGEYCELGSAGQCCGSAGVYNLLHPEVSRTIIGAKVAEVRALGAGTMVTANPGCELQWRMGVLQSGLDARVCHIVDYLYEQGIEAPRPVAREAAAAPLGA